jgi:hypothetical protein
LNNANDNNVNVANDNNVNANVANVNGIVGRFNANVGNVAIVCITMGNVGNGERKAKGR